MAVELNHTIVWCKDQEASSRFLAEMLGRPPPVKFARFNVVDLDNGVSMDFANYPMPNPPRTAPQHYAFLISEAEFDAVFGRIEARKLDYWADPFRQRPGEINRSDGGRRVYFDDPSGHFLEVLTRAYGR
jgi:catechol 2,3-dioxygenase-like lactoylglutathione lyase family enzyme